MAETSNGQASVVVSKPSMDIRALVEKVNADREAAATTPKETAPPAVEPPKPSAPDPEIAIALERHKSEAEVLRERLARMDEQIKRFQAEEDKAKGDWQYALQRHGYKPEDVLPAWIQGGDAKPNPQIAATGKEQELIERLNKLEGTISGAKEQSERERRMAAVREIMGEKDDYAVVRTIGADQTFLEKVLAEEKRRGIPIGQAELAQMLGEHEKAARDIVKPQIERLAKSNWGRELLKTLLEAEQKAAEAAKPKPSEPEPENRHQSYDDKPVIRLGRDLNASIEAVKKRALAAMGG
jgi:hypothetical protein